MKILHIVRQYTPSVGGLESYVKSMVAHQQKNGHVCEILTLNRLFHGNQAHLTEREIIDNVPVRRVPFFGWQRFFIPKIAPSYFKSFDIVHVHNTDVFFDYIALYAFLTRRPAFATTHGGFFHTSNFSLIKKLYFNLVTRLSCQAYKALFAISENDYRTFRGLNKNLVLQPNAVEPLGNYIASGPDFIYLGRLAKHKNVGRLIDVHARLIRTETTKGILHIVGPEWDVTLTELTAQAKTLGMEDHVRLHGLIPDNELQAILRQCGFYVSASSYEGFGMSMIEAMSIGLIPFVEPNASFADLLRQAAVGLCVDYADPDGAAGVIAPALTTVTSDDRLKAQNFAKQFSWNELTTNTFKIYAEHRGAA